MRRNDREITDSTEIESILADAPVCRIGLAVRDEPNVIPVSFGYVDGAIYIHSSMAGKRFPC